MTIAIVLAAPAAAQERALACCLVSTNRSSLIGTTVRRARSLAHRVIHRLDVAVGGSLAANPPPPPALPLQLSAQGSSVPLPMPTGWSREEVYELLGSISIDGAPAGEMKAYLDEDFERFLQTWDLARCCEGAALEIGANPYFTTVLLWNFTALDVTLTNCFDPAAFGERHQSIEYRDPRTTATCSRAVAYESLNVEAQRFPWEDGRFEVVIFCEVIEHLTVDPVAALLEIHRVLKDGGTLIISTPNIARLENVARLIAGANLYDPYSGYGAFGRHNREFTRHELVKVLEYCGFSVDIHYTADVHPHRAALFAETENLAPLVSGRLNDLGQYLFARCAKSASPRPGRPSELYRSLAQDTLHSWG